MSDYSIYPNAIDGYAQLPVAVDGVTQINAYSVNTLRSAIYNIEVALGILPSGNSENLAARLDMMQETLDDVEALVRAYGPGGEFTVHLTDKTNPHSTDIGNLGTGTLAELNSKVTDATLVELGDLISGGYEFTGGFIDRTTGQSGANDLGTNVEYTQELVDNRRWLRFGFDSTRQLANDVPYWTDPTPAPAGGIGLFGSSYMPTGFNRMFNFTENSAYNAAVEAGDFQYTAATGTLDFSQGSPGDLAAVRFDFNIVPQIANTTVEIALIWATRLEDGTITFTFPLTAQPVFFGTGTVGKGFLNRIMMSAYFASNEDVRAFALPAIRSDNPVLVQPLTILSTLQR